MRDKIDRQWFIVLGIFLCSLISGTVGFMQYYEARAAIEQDVSPIDVWDALFKAFQLLSLEAGMSDPKPFWLSVGRWLAIVGVGGTFISTLLTAFRINVSLWRIKNHVVVCGLGSKGLALVHHYRKARKRVVVIEPDAMNDEIRAVQRRGAVVLVGSATDTVLLRRARVHKAAAVAIVSGCDDVNIKIALRVSDVGRAARGQRHLNVTDDSRRVFLHLTDPRMHTLFRSHDLYRCIAGELDFKSVNMFDITARRAMENISDALEPRNVESAIQLGIVGFGWMAKHLALQAAQVLSHPDRPRPTIRILAKDADKTGAAFLREFSILPSFISVQFSEHDTDAMDVETVMGGFGGHVPEILIVAIENELVASTLFNLLRTSQSGYAPYLALSGGTSVIDLLQSQAAAVNPPGRNGSASTGLIYSVSDAETMNRFIEEEAIERLAQLIQHDRYQNKLGNSAMPWHELTAEKREDRRFFASRIIRLAPPSDRLGRHTVAGYYSQQNGEFFRQWARIEHHQFWAYKSLNGWKKGKTYDSGRSLDPSLVSWNEIPNNEKDSMVQKAMRIPSIMRAWCETKSDGYQDL